MSSVPSRIVELMADRTAGQAFFGCNMAAASAPRGRGVAKKNQLGCGVTSRRRLVLPVCWRTLVRCHVSGRSNVVPPTEDVLGEMPPTEAIQELGLPVVSGDLPAELTPEIAAGITSGAGGGCGDDGRGVTAAKLGAEKPFVLSEGLPPVPSRLVARILRGEFVDMAELLRDNLEAHRRAVSSQSTPSTSGGTTGERFQTSSAGCSALECIWRW